nr:hypothetical protein [Streptomyces antimycoticus]
MNFWLLASAWSSPVQAVEDCAALSVLALLVAARTPAPVPASASAPTIRPSFFLPLSVLLRVISTPFRAARHPIRADAGVVS